MEDAITRSPTTHSPWSASSTTATLASNYGTHITQDGDSLANHTKCEGDTSRVSAAEAERRISELKSDTRMAVAETKRRSTTGLFKNACSTDLLFLMDTTYSMSEHINAAKKQVKSIINDIRNTFLDEAEVRMAVVGYKDHKDKPNIEFLDFTQSADRVRAFVSGLRAKGGGDQPEDVLGGLLKALNASWKHQTRCIIHIADAPPHGRLLNDLTSIDDYSEPGSEPHHLSHVPLLRQMLELKINYALLRINGTTDRMAFAFFEAYSAAFADCKLHLANKYHGQARILSTRLSSSYRGKASKRSGKGLLFEEAELGTSFDALRYMVVKLVTSSVSRTAVRMSVNTIAPKKLDMNLLSIAEYDDNNDDVKRLDKGHPQWDKPSWFNETLILQGFSSDVVVHGSGTLDTMMAHDDNIRMSATELIIRKRSRPFAQGAMRVTTYACTAASTNRFVVKAFKREGKRLAHFAEDMRSQALCKAFALEFNALVGEVHSLDFIVTTCLKGKRSNKSKLGFSLGDSGDECMSLEPFIDGTYTKYNSNSGYVNEDNPNDPFNLAAQAFSHFTFERSGGRFLVSDLQGVNNVLTDPAVHTLDTNRFRLAETNLNKEGFKFFFATHACNSICTKLGLKSNAQMIRSGRYYFRENWPSLANTVCCSNKLCGKIVRLTSAKRSNKFPGFYWCNMCRPQLDSSTVKWACVAPGDAHEFEVSQFFYESQGRITPRRCAKHRDEDIEVSGSVGWARNISLSKEGTGGYTIGNEASEDVAVLQSDCCLPPGEGPHGLPAPHSQKSLCQQSPPSAYGTNTIESSKKSPGRSLHHFKLFWQCFAKPVGRKK